MPNRFPENDSEGTRQEAQEEKLRKELVIEEGQQFIKMKESRQ
jgi:hypothetical protein